MDTGPVVGGRTGPALRWLMGVSTVCLAIAIGSLAYLSTHSRYLTDEYVFAAVVRREGLLRAQIYWYQSWRGVYSHTLAISLASLPGPGPARYLPAAVLILWYAGLVWAVFEAAAWMRQRRPLAAALLIGGAILFATVYGVPSIALGVLWQSGMLSYTAPLVLLTRLVGIAMRGFRAARANNLPRPLFLVAAGVLAFGAAGFSEEYAAFQAGTLVLAIAVSFRLSMVPAGLRRAAVTLLAAALVSSALAMAVIALAPGNAVRRTLLPAPLHPALVPPFAMLHAVLFSLETVLTNPVPMGVLVLASGVAAVALHPRLERPMPAPRTVLRHAARWALLYPVLPVTFAIMPSIYAFSVRGSLYGLMTPQFLVVSALAILAYLVGLATRQLGIACHGRLGLLAALLLTLAPLAFAGRTVLFVPVAKAYAARWDARHQALLEAQTRGDRDVTVEALGFSGGLSDITPDPGFWVNQGMARYYQIPRISARA